MSQAGEQPGVGPARVLRAPSTLSRTAKRAGRSRGDSLPAPGSRGHSCHVPQQSRACWYLAPAWAEALPASLGSSWGSGLGRASPGNQRDPGAPSAELTEPAGEHGMPLGRVASASQCRGPSSGCQGAAVGEAGLDRKIGSGEGRQRSPSLAVIAGKPVSPDGSAGAWGLRVRHQPACEPWEGDTCVGLETQTARGHVRGLRENCSKDRLPMVPEDPDLHGPLSPESFQGQSLLGPEWPSGRGAGSPVCSLSPAALGPSLGLSPSDPSSEICPPLCKASPAGPASGCQARPAKQSPHSEPRGENSKQVGGRARTGGWGVSPPSADVECQRLGGRP